MIIISFQSSKNVLQIKRESYFKPFKKQTVTRKGLKKTQTNPS